MPSQPTDYLLSALLPVGESPAARQRMLRELVHLAAPRDASDHRNLQRLTEAASEALGIERASLWLFTPDRDAIACIDLYDARSRQHSEGQRLLASDHPAYFGQLVADGQVNIRDALTHPATATFAQDYLRPLRIGSLLDTPVYLQGALAGVLCLEGCHGQRIWSSDDLQFATALAMLAGLGLEQRERARSEAALRLREEQDRHHQKMEALGRLACTVAHDLNNLLGIVRGHAELLTANPDMASLPRRAARLIEASDRASQLAARLLAFGRAEPTAYVRHDLGDLVRRCESLLRQTMSDSITLDCRIVAAALPKDCDALGIEQILLNLVTNARDAITGEGTISLSLTEDPPGRAALVVEDNGCGMDAATARRIFEPFFTTKGVKGNGLGLAIVYAMVTQHGGTITVDSVPGRGTRFVISLPLDQGDR